MVNNIEYFQTQVVPSQKDSVGRIICFVPLSFFVARRRNIIRLSGLLGHYALRGHEPMTTHDHP